MAKVKHRRKKYLILVRFQLKYILYILFFLYVGAAVAGYTVYWTTWVTLGEKLANVYPRGRLVYIFHAANVALLFRIALITPVFIVLGVFLSHRIAGPIYRIGTYIDTLIKGDYSMGLSLRKKDELKGLALKMSELRDSLKDGSDKRAAAAKRVINILEKKKIPSGVLKEVKSELETMK